MPRPTSPSSARRASTRLRAALAPLAASAALAAALQLAGCQTEDKAPPEAAVLTLNRDYHRLRSNVMARRIRVPTEANLDYAAYSKNVMLADPEWRAVHPAHPIGLGDLGFDGLVEETKPILDFTPLTEAEKSRPMAWVPALDHLLKWNFGRASALADAYSAVTAEKWGDTSGLPVPLQEFGSLYVHSRGNVKEAWVELEFRPWIGSSLEGIMDRDQDRFPEVYARLNPDIFTPAMVDELLGDYSTKALMEPEVLDWARSLASRWGPVFEVEFAEVRPGLAWPYEDVPMAAKRELAGNWVANPLFILQGRPFQDTVFNVFELDGMGVQKPVAQKRREGRPTAGGVDKGLSGRLEAIAVRIASETLEFGGGSWEAWNLALGPLRDQVRAFEAVSPPRQGLPGRDGHLVFRRDLEYLGAPDWSSPAARQKPLPMIAALKDRLAAQGVDFLFVPIPTKLDLYPEIALFDSLRPPGGRPVKMPGGIVQPWMRKALQDLAEARVETVDLLPPFLRLKAASDSGRRELYQRQDSHWTTVGLETAAQLVAERVRNYSWFDSAYRDKRDYRFRDTVFEALGDLQARLPDGSKALGSPETLKARMVLDREGTLYEDSAQAPILVLGDGYTGVFHSVGCRHAGFSAHLAARLGGPVDLIMGWSGGPEAAQKLIEREAGALDGKRLVVWLISARDLFTYPGEWSVPESWARNN